MARSKKFKAHGESLSATDTDRRDPASSPAIAHRREERDHDPGSAGPEGMSQRDRAAAHVELLRRNPQFLRGGHWDHGKRFIYLPAINVGHLPRGPGERQFDGLHGG